MDWLKLIHGAPSPAAPADFGTGDEVRVWYRIREQGKERLGQFEGVVIRCRGSRPARTFTVRRITHGEGVERIFPMDAKTVSRVEVLRKGHVKRSRLYFLRTVIGKTRIASQESPQQANQGKPTEAIPNVVAPSTSEAPAERSS